MAGNLTLRQLSNTGDTTKGSPLSNIEVDQNFINLKDASTITVFDDVTNYFDGTTRTFSLSCNTVPITVSSPHALLITLGSVLLQPYIVNTYENYVWQQEIDVTSNGDFTVSGSSITFIEAPTRSQPFYGRLLGTYVNAADTITRSIFRAIPIVLS